MSSGSGPITNGENPRIIAAPIAQVRPVSPPLPPPPVQQQKG